MPVTPPKPEVSRRGLLDLILGICGGITGIAMFGPALAYIWPVAKSGPVKSREEVGDAAKWEVWIARKVAVGGKPVLVIRTDQGFVAMSAVCTHLGCLVEFDSAKRTILCPCHAGVFDLKGQVTGGPPPKPLFPYSTSVVQGKVFVSV